MGNVAVSGNFRGEGKVILISRVEMRLAGEFRDLLAHRFTSNYISLIMCFAKPSTAFKVVNLDV